MEKPGEPAGTVLVEVSGGKGLVLKLKKHGIHAVVCKNVADLSKRFDGSTDAIVLTERTLPRPNPLRRVLAAQPPWSDIPLIGTIRSNAASNRLRYSSLAAGEKS